MSLSELVRTAYAQRASDLHLEPGLPVAMRIDGALRMSGEPMPPAVVREMAQSVAGDAGWEDFREDHSLDLSRSLAGVRCRINILRTRRGVGLAIRLLAAATATLETLNLHPSLRELVDLPHGLVLVCGPTGSGKSSTIAALVQELNLSMARHVITLEQPVEYWFKPQRAFIRQREVGRDTPSFEKGLMDALREDPDVLVVGEMRRPETMRLTLDAAETGHLVFSTVHSSTVVEALHRVISAFPSDAQASVRAQLADCLAGVVCQHLIHREDLGLRVPECEVLRMTSGARAAIREGRLLQVATALETGADAGSWTLERYRRWLADRPSFVKPPRRPVLQEAEPETGLRIREAPRKQRPKRSGSGNPAAQDGVFVLDEVGGDATTILSELLSE